MNCKNCLYYLWAIIVVLLFAAPVSAQQLRNRVAPICTDVSDTATAQEAGFIPCDWYQTGTGSATPGYVRLVDQNTTLMLDVQRLSTLVTGLAGTYGAAITASTLFLYDGSSGMFGPWYRRFPTSDTMTNSEMGGAPVLSANFGFNATSGRWARFRLDTSFRLITSIQDPLDAGGNVKVGIFDAAGDGPADVNANDDLSVTLNNSAGAAFMDSTTAPGYQRLQDGDSTLVADVLPAHADGLALTLNGLSTSAVMMLYNGATLDMGRAGAVGELQVTDVATRPGEDAGNDWRKIKKEETAVVAPIKTTTAVDDAAGGITGDVVLASTHVLNTPNWCVVFKNEGGGSGNALADADVFVSPSGAAGEWEDVGTNDCDTLASGGGSCSYCCSNCAHAYVKAEALCGAGNDTTVTTFLRGNKN